MNEIPHCKGLPLIGHGLAAVRNPLGFLERVSEKYGRLVWIRLAGKRYYLAQGPEECRHILQGNARNYYKPGLAKELKQFLREGLATSNGEHWLRQRRLIQPAFHQKRMGPFLRIIEEETSSLVARWKAGPLPEVKSVNQSFLNLTLANITRTMFGADLRSDLPEIAAMVNDLLEYSAQRAVSVLKWPRFVPTPANLRFKRANKAFEEVLYTLIRQRKSRNDGSDRRDFRDVLDLLMRAYDDATQSHMTRDQLRDEVATIFMAGHETTAQTLSWVFYHLAAYPAVAERAREEAAQGADEDLPPGTVPQLTYIRSVIEETLRLYPPVWIIVRRAKAEDMIEGATLPAGATVLLNVYGVHRDRRFWTSPLRFDPERFFPENRERLPPFAYIPFGGGPRICIGNHFAMMVMQTVVSRLIREFHFDLPASFRPQVIPGITLRAKGGIRLRISAR